MKNIVVAPQPRAVEAGIEMYRKGGNAIDAAVATGFAQGVIDPTNTSLGGMGVLSIYHAKSGDRTMISFHGKAPLNATPTMFEPIPGQVDGPMSTGTWLVKDYANQLGYKSITVPGDSMALCQALAKYGTIPLKEVLQPAIRYANEGWRVGAEQRQGWLRPTPSGRLDILTRFRATPPGAKLYTKNNGQPLDVGDLVVNKDLGNTLSKIAEGGADVFYKGEIARTIADDFKKHGGLITEKDLNQYQTRIESPLKSTYRGYDLTSSTPPAGGLVVLQMLNILEGFELSKMDPMSVEYVHLLAETMRLAYYDMNRYLGDPAFVKIPLDRLLSKEYAAECRKKINPNQRMELPKIDEAPSGETTQVTAVDAQGNAVSLTHTLGAVSGVVTAGLGFMYNGAMHRFNPNPGFANSIVPGKSRVTGMSTTMVFKDGKLFMCLGAPGGQSIILGVFQTILNVIDHKISVLEAVSVPRFHCEGGAITLENRYPSSLLDELKKKGHPVAQSMYSYDGQLSGNVHAVVIDRAADKLTGAADPRSPGTAMYY
ncbi:MAG: gamma-glutamyltransferase [Chloroflexota bacterium]